MLDDVFSELDIKRRERLIESLKDIQSFITMAEYKYIDEFKELIEGFLDINAVFLGHGESESKKELQEEAQKRNGLNVQILKRGEAFKIFEDKIRHSS